MNTEVVINAYEKESRRSATNRQRRYFFEPGTPRPGAGEALP